jgi:signal transduction histidine kinase
VAHELGAPLSVVRGRAQRLLRDAGATETIAREAGEIQNQVVRMEAIVRQLLDFGRRRSSEPRLASIGDVVERAGAAARELASGARIEVTLDLPTTEARMLDDPAGLELALGNLLRNALDASPEGNVLLTVSATPDAVRITVDDDGPGVPEAIRARVFEPFFTTKSVGEGTGLGLALAHRTIEDMGALLDVESSPLGGARFTITVPADGLMEARG